MRTVKEAAIAAKEAGFSTFTGFPCPNGHDERYASNRKYVACAKALARSLSLKHHARVNPTVIYTDQETYKHIAYIAKRSAS